MELHLSYKLLFAFYIKRLHKIDFTMIFQHPKPNKKILV